MSKKRCAIYVRVSDEEQISGLSLDVQEKACKKAAADKGFAVVKVYRDEGFSAFSRKPRPAYVQMMSETDKFDAIFVWKIDRFGRRLSEILGAVERLVKAETGLCSVTEPEYNLLDPMGWSMFVMASMWAELSSRLTSSRVTPAMEEACIQGRTIARPPFGYMLPAPKAVIVPDPKYAPVLHEIFERYAAGESLVQICRWLDGNNVPTPKTAKYWMPQSVKSLLRCRTYLGKVVNTRVGKEFEGLHEALIDDELWWACQDRLAKNKLISPRARNGSLSSLLFCGYCGGGLRYDGKSYSCTRNAFQQERHERVHIRGYLLEGVIWKLVEDFATADADNAFRNASVRTDNSSAIGRLQAEKRSIEERLKYNLMAGHDEAVPIGILVETNRPLNERLAQIQDEVTALRDQSPVGADLSSYMEGLEEIKASGFSHKRDFLSGLFSRIAVYRDRITFESVVPGGKPLAVVRPRIMGTMKREYEIKVVS